MNPAKKLPACLVVTGVLLTPVLSSCTSNSSTDEPNRLSIQDSTLAAAEQPVSQRPAPEVHRIGYRVDGQGDPSQNWGDLYLPGGIHQEKSVPLVVLIHGGAWHRSIGAGDFSTFARSLAGRGVAVYNIEYRRVGSGGGWPTTFTDVTAALDHVPQLLRDHPELSGRTEVVGHSAGAQLATWAGTRNTQRPSQITRIPGFKPERIVAISGPLDMTFAANSGDEDLTNVIGGNPTPMAARYKDVDPIQNIDPTIPVAAIHGMADAKVPWQLSQRYVQTAQQAGGQAEFYPMYGDTHGSLITPGSTHYSEVLDLITNHFQC
ncbi:alpha/beta hydrolase family protein [Rothia uropygioeca]|uniref:alpha/beta hydrolase family protein n=1 Tax=Kocuria sp. 257 TaxID=2021970 RepID=UPI00101053A6|nr:alpha/beta fold hydrolase [Kocuria sp. 257]